MVQLYLFSIQEATRVVMGARKINQIENTIEDWQQGALPEDIFNEITNVLLGISTTSRKTIFNHPLSIFEQIPLILIAAQFNPRKD